MGESEVEILCFGVKMSREVARARIAQLRDVCGATRSLADEYIGRMEPDQTIELRFPIILQDQGNLVARLEALDRILDDPRVEARIRSNGVLVSIIGKITAPKSRL